MLTVEIIERTAPALKRLAVDAESPQVADAIGRAVVDLLRRHFRSLPPNKHNWPSTGFWQRAADATRYEVTPDGPVVSIKQTGVRQQLFGGIINAVRGKFLTIPGIAAAYGHRATEFPFLRLCLTTYHGNPALGLAPSSEVTANRGQVPAESVWYFLRRSVSQLPNPGVMPRDSEIRDVAREAAASALFK